MISQSPYLANDPLWVSYSKHWERWAKRIYPGGHEKRISAFYNGLSLGYEAGRRDATKTE